MENQTENKVLRRVLVLADSPTVPTGFGVVIKNLMWQLQATGKYWIDIIGINFYGDFYETKDYPYRIFPAVNKNSQDLYGRPRLELALAGYDNSLKGPWDILFTLNDHFILETVAPKILNYQQQFKDKGHPEQHFKWIGYCPVDSSLRENWVTQAVVKPDYPVTYTNYARDETLKFDDKEGSLAKRLKVIYHGVNTKEFYPISTEEKKTFRQLYFGGTVRESTFVVTNVSRNQPRKDLARTMKIFAEFHKRHPDSFLYLHSKIQDAGGSLEEMARNFGLEHNKDWTTPAAFDENIGFPTEILNKIYNISDVTLTTSLGEGWGFMLTESMATNTLTMGPSHTAIKEILNGEDITEASRGIPVKCATTSSEWISLGFIDNERIRPLTNVADGVEKLTWVYDHPEEAKQISQRGYEWALAHTWEIVCKDWIDLFDTAYQELEVERTIKRNKTQQKANRQNIARLRK